MKIYVLVDCTEGAIYHAFKAKPTVEDLMAVGIDRDDAIEIEVNDHSCYLLQQITLHDNVKRSKKSESEWLVQGGRCLESFIE